jgi:hypothetical protein
LLEGNHAQHDGGAARSAELLVAVAGAPSIVSPDKLGKI